MSLELVLAESAGEEAAVIGSALDVDDERPGQFRLRKQHVTLLYRSLELY
jgi:hypothetical protein